MSCCVASSGTDASSSSPELIVQPVSDSNAGNVNWFVLYLYSGLPSSAMKSADSESYMHDQRFCSIMFSDALHPRSSRTWCECIGA